MKIPGMRWIRKAESKANEAEVPVAQNLGLVDFVKLTYTEMDEDHVMAFAGNLTYKALFAVFPLTFLLSLLGLFNATDLVDAMVDDLWASRQVGHGVRRGTAPEHHPEPGPERVHVRGDHLGSARTVGRLGGVQVRHGGYERHVRGR